MLPTSEQLLLQLQCLPASPVGAGLWAAAKRFPAGWGGKNCMERYEQYCPNQCNGRGECELGYCHCDPGGAAPACPQEAGQPHQGPALQACPACCACFMTRGQRGRWGAMRAIRSSCTAQGGMASTVRTAARLPTPPLLGARPPSAGWQSTCTRRRRGSLRRAPCASGRLSTCEPAGSGALPGIRARPKAGLFPPVYREGGLAFRAVLPARCAVR